jgi:hypothetical protein
LKIDEVVYEQDADAPKGWAIDLTIDEGATAHIMKVLTDLYSNPILAVIREYSTNAVDAHVEAGRKFPIKVTLPTVEDPNFRVRDFGLGLTYNDIEVMYSRYGASTKRETNDAVGMLGLGCKSALTYTNAFSLRGIVNQDGVHIESKVEVRRNEQGGTMTVLGETETDEETGVEIIVPVKSEDIDKFNEEAANFFRFWGEGEVLVNGAEPKKIDGYELADGLMVSSEVDTHTIVMGGVPYPVESGIYVNDLGYNYKAIMWVNIGDVHFVPSREALADTQKTKDTVALMNKALNAKLNPALNRILDAAPNHYEALKLSKNLYHVGLKKPVYKGDPIPSHINRVEQKLTEKDSNGNTRLVPDPNFLPLVIVSEHYRGTRTSTTHQVNLEADQTIWLDGSDEKKALTPYKREKLSIWKRTNSITGARFALVDKLTADEKRWINPSLIYSYADVKATKVVREKVERSDGRPSGSYVAYVKTTDNDIAQYKHDLLAADINASKPLFYVMLNESTHTDMLSKLNSEYTLVTLGKNRVQKFLRDFPNAKAVLPFLKDAADAWASKLTDEDKKLIALSETRTHDQLLKLDENRIDDPALAENVRLAKTISTSKVIKLHEDFEDFTSVELPDLDDPMDKYPLAYSVVYSYYKPESTQMEHAYLYMNMIYNQSLGEKRAEDFFARLGFQS